MKFSWRQFGGRLAISRNRPSDLATEDSTQLSLAPVSIKLIQATVIEFINCKRGLRFKIKDEETVPDTLTKNNMVTSTSYL